MTNTGKATAQVMSAGMGADSLARTGFAQTDTTTAQGVLVFHMFSALAEFERALIRERTPAGLAAEKRAGRTGGRPAKLTEKDLDFARTLLANTDTTVGEIAGRLGVSPATLYRYSGGADCKSPRIVRAMRDFFRT